MIHRHAAALMLSAIALAAITEEPKVVWLKTLGAGETFYRPYAIAGGPDATLFVAGTSTRVGAPLLPNGRRPVSFWLWKLNAAGISVWQTELPDPLPETPVGEAYPAMHSVAPTQDGGAALIVEFAPDKPFFIRVDRDGKPLVVTRVPIDGLSTIYDLVVVESDKYVLAGQNGQSPVILKVNASGRKLWSRTFERGKPSRITRLLPLSSGFLIGGEIGQLDVLNGQRSIWLARLDAEGQVKGETTMTGRSPGLARSGNGLIAVAYDRGGAQNQEFIVAGYTPAFEKKWERPLLQSGYYNPSPVSVVVDRSGFVIGAGDRGQLALWRVADDGRLLWSYREAAKLTLGLKQAESMSRIEGDPVIVAMAVDETPKRKAAFKVGLVRIAGHQ